MANFSKRQLLKAKGRCTTSYTVESNNTFQKLSHSSAAFIKIPVNTGDWLKKESNKKAWKVFKLYIKYLDLKVQNPDCGTFKIEHSPRFYQRLIKQLITKGWASREGRKVYLRAYQFVWRDMGISRIDHKGVSKFKYWKIPVSMFSENRKDYLKEIEHEIRKKISKRKRAQLRYALKEKDNSRATFSSRSAGALFGYKSPASGTKLRSKYFEVIPMSEEETKPRWNKERGRYEEPTKQIAL